MPTSRKTAPPTPTAPFLAPPLDPLEQYEKDTGHRLRRRRKPTPNIDTDALAINLERAVEVARQTAGFWEETDGEPNSDFAIFRVPKNKSRGVLVTLRKVLGNTAVVYMSKLPGLGPGYAITLNGDLKWAQRKAAHEAFAGYLQSKGYSATVQYVLD